MFETTLVLSGISGVVKKIVSPSPASSERIPEIGSADNSDKLLFIDITIRPTRLYYVTKRASAIQLKHKSKNKYIYLHIH